MDLKISSPCPMRWEDLTGDDRIRHCDRCRLNVYNLAVMDKEEIESLFRSATGRVCGRLYLRGDRTATRRDCSQSRADRIRRRLQKAFAGILLLVFVLVSRNVARPNLSSLPTWARALVTWVDPEPPVPQVQVLGAICPPKNPTPPPTPTVGP